MIVRRREFMTLIGVAAAWPAMSRAQDRVRVIGILETMPSEWIVLHRSTSASGH
jgi:hypothetical protein